MKKIVMGIAAVAMAASMFAVDFAATTKVKGDIAAVEMDDSGKTTVTSIKLGGVENTAQKDTDLLEVAFTGDNAGASFKFWTNVAESAVTMRGLKVWFKPIDSLTVSTGNTGLSLYTERLNWWKVPCGASFWQSRTWDHRWSSAAALKDDALGITAEFNMNGLYVGAGIAPGSDAFFFTDANLAAKKDAAGNPDASNAAYGVVAKYQIMDNVSAGVAWRDDGTGNAKILTVGADFGNWGTPYYGFLQGKVYFDDHIGWGYYDNDWMEKEPTLAGICIDNYISYNLGSVKLEATAPITIRGLWKSKVENRTYNTKDGTLDDPTYMTLRVKATIPMDAISLYVVAGSFEGFNNGPAALASTDKDAGDVGNMPWRLDGKFMDYFSMYGNVGVTFNVGSCALDLGVEVGYSAEVKKTVIAIPFSAQVKF
jgi:hypothetical protein